MLVVLLRGNRSIGYSPFTEVSHTSTYFKHVSSLQSACSATHPGWHNGRADPVAMSHKVEKELFVTGHHGTSKAEVFALVMAASCSIVMCKTFHHSSQIVTLPSLKVCIECIKLP